MLKRLFLFLSVFLFSTFTALSASRFLLVESRTGKTFGPYTLYHGAKVRVGGDLYELSLLDQRFSFIGKSGNVYGPYQPVEGRLMRVGDVMYTYSSQTSTPPQQPTVIEKKPVVPAVPEKPIAEFRPIPPKQEMLPIPAENARRTVAPLDLPALPSASKPLTLGFWVAPMDTTPFKWSVENFSGSDSDLERTTVGAGIYCNAWTIEAQYAISAEGGDIVPSGMGVASSTLDDGNSKAIALGYKRPFLKEGSWSALAGVYAKYRIDEIDLSVKSLSQGTVIGTNDVESYFSSYSTKSSSLEITEFLLRIDLELTYSQENWGASAAALVYAFSDVSVSGEFPYSSGPLNLSAKHDDPIAFRLAGWYRFIDGWSVNAALTLVSETELRLGFTHSF